MFVFTRVAEKIKSLPSRPGVYQFLDRNGEIIYVGKAKDLKKRVSSYAKADSSNWKIFNIQSISYDLEVKETKDELSALLLEAKLIQAHKPRLNVLLKTNQPFLYFLITKPTKQSPVSKVELVYENKQQGTYFGPFINKGFARKLYELLNKTFGTRICSRKIPGGCLYYHLGQCGGFCLDNFDVVEYNKKIRMIEKFFLNGPARFINSLEKKIIELSEEENFEEASVLSRYVDFLKSSELDLANISSMNQLLARLQNCQHIWLVDENESFLLLLEHQNNHLQKKQFFFLIDYPDFSLDDFITFFYQNNPAPIVVYVNFTLQDKPLLQTFLKEWQHHDNDVSIINFSKTSLNQTFLDLSLAMLDREVQAIYSLPLKLQSMLNLINPVFKIDCFDISHHQELAIVGSCVRFENGRPNHTLFRHFKIKSTEIPNDYQSLREIVYRRYSSDFDNRPDLVLIDGGKGQLQAVQHLFPEMSFVSLAKKEETLFWTKMVDGKLFFINKKLNLLTQEGLFFTRIRDTAHNFAVSYHRKLKNKLE